VIGYLEAGSPQGSARDFAKFRIGLSETGYAEGRNLTIEYRWAEGHYDRLPALAADLVRRHVTVIAATTTRPALAAKAATSAIPIVFQTGADPVRDGLVSSLKQPIGNVTGVTSMNADIMAKRLPTSGNQRPCRDAGVGAIAPGFAMLKRSKRASHIDPPASSYAIMRRAGPYRGENPAPGKDC
jgi:hypothetical protein